MQEIKNLYDVVVTGGGPAGLSAAIYAARAKYRVLVLEKEGFGGQITITSEVVNYPGILQTSGKELTEKMRQQAESFGAEFVLAEVLDMELEADYKLLHTTRGDFHALGVILATGANPRKLGFLGEKEFQGRGVAYCATCDGEFFTGMDIYVVGGGFAAVEEGIFLTKYARRVTMLVRGETFSCAGTVAEKALSHEKIDVKFHTEIVEAGGEDMVTYARFRDNNTGKEWEASAEKDGPFGIFVFAGYVPNTGWIPRAVARDKQGYLITDENHRTSLEGVYAAGDVCIKNLRQVVTAVSDGAIAATALEKYLGELHRRLGIPERDSPKPVKTQKAEPGHEQEKNTGFISPAIREQLEGIFARFVSHVIVKTRLDDSPLSGEITGFLGELAAVTDKVIWKTEREPVPGEQNREEDAGGLLPSIDLYREDGSFSGIRFHGVPGGHEFNSFIIALYNVAGPGQEADPGLISRLQQLKEKVNVKVLVSLSCTMCPETVMAAQKAAAVSPLVSAEMFDLMHYPELKNQYKVMSVPCIVVNDDKVYFGKKRLPQITDLLTGVS